MANSTKSKDKKSLDTLADDLDAMLNMDATPAAQKVGEIEDDDAIDRLLMGDNFQHVEEGSEIDEFADDIDDMIANIQNDPKHPVEPVIGDVDEFADVDEDAGLVKSIDEVMTPELMALESVAEIDEFIDEFVDDTVRIPAAPDIQQDQMEGMNEINEFPEVSPASGNHTDFLMADFDISSDEDMATPIEAEQLIDEFADDAVETPDSLILATSAAADSLIASVAKNAAMAGEVEASEPIKAALAATVAEKTLPQVDHSEELAALANQITVLKKQHQVFKQEMTDKAGKDELVKCLEEIDSLQANQKKNRRAIEAVGNSKPVAAYIANGLAVTALLVGAGLGFQGFIAKSQVGELVPIIGKLQEQINATPAVTVAGNDMLRKQLDELTAASGQASNQIAEINKMLQGDSGSAKTGGDLGKQIADLNSQNLQMGAAIEALQSKVNALEKGRAVTAASVPKPEKKKPAAVAENWAVNLIAFKQDWYAKRKAEEFAAKGVPAKVSKTESKGENWYRLSVDGFNSQYEAAGYAAKVKKTLNLDSVWVTRNKD